MRCYHFVPVTQSVFFSWIVVLRHAVRVSFCFLNIPPKHARYLPLIGAESKLNSELCQPELITPLSPGLAKKLMIFIRINSSSLWLNKDKPTPFWDGQTARR